MKGLIVKDLLLIKNSLSWVYLFPIIVICVCGGADPYSFAMLIEMVIPLFFGFFVYNTLYADENSHWDRYRKGLPLKPSAVVLSKYVLSGLMIAGSLLASIAISSLFVALADVNVTYMCVIVCAGVSLGVLYLAILIPSVLHFGVSKGPIVFIGCVAVMTLIPASVGRMGVTFDLSSLFAHPILLMTGLLGVSCLAAILSLCISLKVICDTKR